MSGGNIGATSRPSALNSVYSGVTLAGGEEWFRIPEKSDIGAVATYASTTAIRGIFGIDIWLVKNRV